MPPPERRHLIAIGVPGEDVPQVAKSVELVVGCLTTLGYSHERPELANLQLGVDLKKELSLWAREIAREDIAILYFAGHGGTVGKRHYLGLRGTNWRFPATEALASEELVRALADGTDLTNLLVILDTCYSGQAGFNAQAIADSLIDKPDRAFWLLAASRPKQEAGDGDFAVALDNLIRAHRGAAIRRYEMPTLLADLNSRLREFQRANLSQIGAITGELPDFLPNPKFIAEALQGRPIEDRPFFESDLQQHWKSRAIGSEAIFQSGQWYFTGREAALRRIISWLDHPDSQGRGMAVTGDPGSGKSALLGYLIVASDSQEVQEPAFHAFLAAMPEGTRPAAGSITLALPLRGKTLFDAQQALAERFRTTPDQIVNTLTGNTEHRVLVFDALDEAAEPSQIANLLLRPLTGYPNLRVIVGTRRPEIQLLGPRFDPLDLDLAEYRSDADIARYVERLLLAVGETRASPYKGEKAEKAQAVAAAVAARASGNYLIARTIARALMERDSCFDPAQESIPRNMPEAFDDYLKQREKRSGLGEGKLRELLIPLAYVYGQGLPVEVWELFAQTSVSPALEFAAAFIAEFAEDGHAVYRLYHQALADALRDAKQDAIRQRRMAQSLYKALLGTDWFRADWFTRKYFANYATGGYPELLEQAMLDVKFLAAAESPRLLAAAPRLLSSEGQRRLNWLRLTADRLTEGDDGDHLSQLEFVAQQNGALDLAAECERTNTRYKWRAKWASWSRQSTPHRTLRGHVNAVNSVALSDGVVVSGSDDYTVRFWSAATGEAIGQPGKHDSTAVAASGGLAMSGGRDGTVCFWELKSGKAVCPPLNGHKGRVLAVALGDGFAASGDSGGTVTLWDLTTFKMRGELRRPDTASVNAICIVGDFVICGLNSGVLEFWNKGGSQDARVLETSWKTINSLAASEGFVAALGDNRTFCRIDLAANQWMTDPIPLHTVVHAIALANETLVCACTDFSVRLFEAKTGNPISVLSGHNMFVKSVAVDGNTIASGSADNTIRIWDRSLTQPLGVGPASASGAAAQLTIGGSAVVSAHWDRSLSFWSLDDGKELKGWKQSVGILDPGRRTIAASDKMLAFLAEDGRLVVRDLATQIETAITEPNASASVLEISNDFLVLQNEKERVLRRWSLNPLQSLGIIALNDPVYYGLKIDQDVVWAVSGNALLRWNLVTGQCIGDPGVDARETADLAISGNVVVSGHWGGYLKTWSKTTGAFLRSSDMTKRTGRLKCVEVFHDVVLSGGSDETLFVWNVNTLELLFRIPVGSGINGMAVYPKGVCVACAAGIACLELNL